MRIMIIDDDPTTFNTLEKSLEKNGHEVIWASSGKKGLEKLKEEHPDVVFLEPQLPDDGLAVLRKIKRHNPSTVVVALTAFATVDAAVKAMASGAFDYVRKPLEPAELQSCVLSILKKVNNSWRPTRGGGGEGMLYLRATPKREEGAIYLRRAQWS